MKLDEITLLSGSHNSPDDGMCAMEAVAYIQGEPFSDSPQCVCPVIATFCRSWNDSMNDDDRNRILKPLLPLVIGTRATPEIESHRAYLAIDWYIRVQLPAWLELTPSLKSHADAARNLPHIIDLKTLRGGEKVLAAARAAAWDAARAAAAGNAAGAAAWAAAGDAAGAAAGAAAWAAAGAAAAWDAAWAAARAAAAGNAARAAAAWAAARDAAGAAAGAAAWAAAGDAAWAALKPTVITLQESAADLLNRMVAAGETEVKP